MKDLLVFDLLEHGILLARRGLIALSLHFGDPEIVQLPHAAILPTGQLRNEERHAAFRYRRTLART